ncbi:MAG: hypothetical protein ABSF03_19145 [Streptosporangiaceae bacterium]
MLTGNSSQMPLWWTLVSPFSEAPQQLSISPVRRLKAPRRTTAFTVVLFSGSVRTADESHTAFVWLLALGSLRTVSV